MRLSSSNVDRGYRGHNYARPHNVFRSGQKRGVHGTIKKELRRRAMVEPIIGHLKSEVHLGRNYLKGRSAECAVQCSGIQLPFAVEMVQTAFLCLGFIASWAKSHRQ